MFPLPRNIVACTLACLCMLAALRPAHAGVIIEGTRVVYPADEREIAVRMTNARPYPVLVEAWIEQEGPDGKESRAVPFALTPPLFRIDPTRGQTLRIFRLPHGFSEDRESLYWLNVRDIPPKAVQSDGEITVAYRSRLKLFHRPAKLSMQPHAGLKSLVWSSRGGKLHVRNPSPYYVTITSVQPDHAAEPHALTGVMVAPFAESEIALDAGAAKALHYEVVNDYGAAVRLPGVIAAVR